MERVAFFHQIGLLADVGEASKRFRDLATLAEGHRFFGNEEQAKKTDRRVKVLGKRISVALTARDKAQARAEQQKALETQRAKQLKVDKARRQRLEKMPGPVLRDHISKLRQGVEASMKAGDTAEARSIDKRAQEAEAIASRSGKTRDQGRQARRPATEKATSSQIASAKRVKEHAANEIAEAKKQARFKDLREQEAKNDREVAKVKPVQAALKKEIQKLTQDLRSLRGRGNSTALGRVEAQLRRKRGDLNIVDSQLNDLASRAGIIAANLKIAARFKY